MYCKNCGKELESGATFCNQCGANNKDTTKKEEAKKETVNEFSQEAIKKVKKIPKGVLMGIGGMAVLIVVIAIFFSQKPTINLNDYLLVEFSGYDTLGEVSFTIDTVALDKDYGNKIELNSETSSTTTKLLMSMNNYMTDAAYMVSECTDGSFDKSDELSNGDVIKFTWNCDEQKAIEGFGCKIKYTDEEYTVEGLESVGVFDPFEEVSVEFSGTDPEGTATVVDESSTGLQYEIDKQNNLKNGDVVTVSIKTYSQDLTEYCIEEVGAIPSETEKTYIVEGLSHYITSASEIPDDMLLKMKKEVEDKLQAYTAQYYEKEVTFDKFTYMGNYFLNKKSTSSAWEKNIFCLVYRVDASAQIEAKNKIYQDTYTYYYCTSLSDIIVLSDGTFSVNLGDFRDKNSYVKTTLEADYTRYYDFSGYGDIDSMFNQVVALNVDNYEYEDNVDVSLIAPDISNEELQQEDLEIKATDGNGVS